MFLCFTSKLKFCRNAEMYFQIENGTIHLVRTLNFQRVRNLVFMSISRTYKMDNVYAIILKAETFKV